METLGLAWPFRETVGLAGLVWPQRLLGAARLSCEASVRRWTSLEKGDMKSTPGHPSGSFLFSQELEGFGGASESLFCAPILLLERGHSAQTPPPGCGCPRVCCRRGEVEKPRSKRERHGWLQHCLFAEGGGDGVWPVCGEVWLVTTHSGHGVLCKTLLTLLLNYH